MINLETLAKKFNLNILDGTNIEKEYLLTEATGISSLVKRDVKNTIIVITKGTSIEEVKEKVSVIVVCEQDELDKEIEQELKKYNKPVMFSKFSKREMISIIDPYLLRKQQTPERAHGTLLSVYGEGVLVTGKSGIGKSELALELINRKHLFCGDDAIDIITFAGKPIGKAPRLSRDFIEVRGVGIINIKGMFGIQSTLKESTIDLIIELVNLDDVKSSVERLGREYSVREINGVKIPLIQIPVSSGRSIAPVVEAAVIAFKQRISDNYIAVNDLTKRLKNS